MATLLKDLYSPEYVAGLSQKIAAVYTGFEPEAFSRSVLSKEWQDLELKGRMHHITKCLHRHIELPYREVIEVLIAIGPDCGRLEGLYLPDFVEKFGLDEDWDLNMYTLAKLTPFASAEFAVRPYILKDTPRMMSQMLHWSLSADLDVRRLASEGCRPRLPWGMALKNFQKDPSLIMPILENLKDDEEEYVRRSVANNLNDISKDHPELVLHVAEKWLSENPGRKRTVKHALRTLLKKGNTRALMLFGFGDPARVGVQGLKMTPGKIDIGAKSHFEFELKVEVQEAQLRVEYAIEFLKKNGTHSRKVFQFTEREFKSGLYTLEKNHSFQQLSTRIHYPGRHKLIILVNGREKAVLDFELM